MICHRRQEQTEADVAFLEKAIEGAPLGDPSDKEMAAIYAGIKARRKKVREGRLSRGGSVFGRRVAGTC